MARIVFLLFLLLVPSLAWAQPAPPGGLIANRYYVIVTKAGTGTGTVTSVPAGVNCGADCNEPYAAGTNVVLTATPTAGSAFTGWSGACSGTGTCSLTMSTVRQVTATFNTAASFTLTVAKAGSGTGTVTSSPAGINCGSDCTEVTASGNVFVLTATAGPGATFTGWSGGGCSGTGTCSVTVTANTTVTATFTARNLQLSWTDNAPSGGGTAETGFQIERCQPIAPATTCTNFTVLTTVGPSTGTGLTVTYTDNAAAPACYRVAAVATGASNSSYTNTACWP